MSAGPVQEKDNFSLVDLKQFFRSCFCRNRGLSYVFSTCHSACVPSYVAFPYCWALRRPILYNAALGNEQKSGVRENHLREFSAPHCFLTYMCGGGCQVTDFWFRFQISDSSFWCQIFVEAPRGGRCWWLLGLLQPMWQLGKSLHAHPICKSVDLPRYWKIVARYYQFLLLLQCQVIFCGFVCRNGTWRERNEVPQMYQSCIPKIPHYQHKLALVAIISCSPSRREGIHSSYFPLHEN